MREASILSNCLDSTEDAFIIRPPPKNSRKYIKIVVYLFGTPKYIEIEVSTEDHASDIVKHIITLYK